MPGEADRLKKELADANDWIRRLAMQMLDADREIARLGKDLDRDAARIKELEERCQLEAKEVADLTRWLDAAGLERDALKEENAKLLLSNGALQVRLNHSTPHGRPDPEVEAMRELRDKAVRQAMEVRGEMKELRKENAELTKENLQLIQEKMGVLHVDAVEEEEFLRRKGITFPVSRPLSLPERQEKLELRVHELEGRVEQVNMEGFEAWNRLGGKQQSFEATSKSHDARLDALEVAQRDLFSRMARLERTEEPLPERRWWWK